MRGSDLDPESDEFRAFKLLGRKRDKSEDDEARLRRLEWSLSLDLDAALGPYVPQRYVKENLREAATRWKKGEDIVRSLVVLEFRVPIEYEGPRDEEGLWDGGFRLSRLVVNNGRNRGAVYRTRPKFDEWSLNATVAWDPEDLDAMLLESVVERAQRFGMGDGRRIGFGSFVAAFSPISGNGGGVRSSAVRSEDPDDRRAHRAKVKEITRA